MTNLNIEIQDINSFYLQNQAMKLGEGINLNKWPNFKQFRFMPYDEKMRIYSMAKDLRNSLVKCGFKLTESYDQYIERIVDELEI